MLSLQQIATALNGEVCGDRVRAPSPGHSPIDRGLSVKLGRNGQPIVSCFNGDWRVAKDYLAEKLGLPKFQRTSEDLGALMREAIATQTNRDRKIIAKYPGYKERDGTLLYTMLKYDDPKARFGWLQPDGTSRAPERRVIYRWPELLEHPYATVFVCEGEKDADNVIALGHCATTVASGKWTDDCVNALADRHCWILEDNDDTGRAKALDAARRLHGVATTIKIVQLPGLSEHGDVSDWLDMGHTKEELEDVCESSPDWEPDGIQPEPPSTTTADETPPKARPSPKAEIIPLSFFGDLKEVSQKPWLIKNVIARGEASSWIAPPGKGKSALLTDMFVKLASGIDWRGYRTKGKFGGLYFALERVDLVKRRLVAHRLRDNLPADLPIAISGAVIDLMGRGCVSQILDAIKRAEDRIGCEIGLVGIDTWAKGIGAGRGDESAAKDQNAALANLRRVLERANIHIATIGHTGKDEAKGERGSNAKQADVDLQIQLTGDSIRTAVVKKANDQAEGPLTSFRLEPFDFGLDEDGDPFRTFILSPEIIDKAETTKRPLNPRQQLAIEALAEVTLSHGVDLPAHDGLPAGLKAVTADQWRDEMYRRNVLDQDAKNPSARFAEVQHQLASKHLIGVRDGRVWLAKAA